MAFSLSPLNRLIGGRNERKCTWAWFERWLWLQLGIFQNTLNAHLEQSQSITQSSSSSPSPWFSVVVYHVILRFCRLSNTPLEQTWKTRSHSYLNLLFIPNNLVEFDSWPVRVNADVSASPTWDPSGSFKIIQTQLKLTVSTGSCVAFEMSPRITQVWAHEGESDCSDIEDCNPVQCNPNPPRSGQEQIPASWKLGITCREYENEKK